MEKSAGDSHQETASSGTSDVSSNNDWKGKINRMLSQPKTALKLQGKLKMDTSFYQEFLRIRKIVAELRVLEQLCERQQEVIQVERTVAKQRLSRLDAQRERLNSQLATEARKYPLDLSVSRPKAVASPCQAPDAAVTSTTEHVISGDNENISNPDGQRLEEVSAAAASNAVPTVSLQRYTFQPVFKRPENDSDIDPPPLVICISPCATPEADVAVLDLTTKTAACQSISVEHKNNDTRVSLAHCDSPSKSAVDETKVDSAEKNALKRKSNESITLGVCEIPVKKVTRSESDADSSPHSLQTKEVDRDRLKIANVTTETSAETVTMSCDPKIILAPASETGSKDGTAPVTISRSRSSSVPEQLLFSPSSAQSRGDELLATLQLDSTILKVATVHPIVTPKTIDDVTQSESVTSPNVEKRMNDAAEIHTSHPVSERVNTEIVTSSSLKSTASKKETNGLKSRGTSLRKLGTQAATTTATKKLHPLMLEQKRDATKKQPNLEPLPPKNFPENSHFEALKAIQHQDVFMHPRDRAALSEQTFPSFPVFRAPMEYQRPLINVPVMNQPWFDPRHVRHRVHMPYVTARFAEWERPPQSIKSSEIALFSCGNRGCRHKSKFVCSQCTRITYCSAECQVSSCVFIESSAVFM